ncbi:MAG: N-6 DNA methylase [Clostridium sp.]|nr:N-6 DNA methylase [Clostridium sp.]
MASIEEKVEDYSKKILDKLGIRYFGKTEKINEAITVALKNANSKSGNSGNNYPDIKLLLSDKYNRHIPVMIEVKGSKNKLEKLDKENNIVEITYYNSDKKNKEGNIIHKKGDANFSAIKDFAVNGALHYGKAIINGEIYNEVIIIGVNGTTLDKDGNPKDFESKAYYVSRKNNCVPKHIKELDDDFALLKQDNIEKLFGVLDELSLTEKEIEDLKRKTESTLEEKIKSIHQSLYEDERLKTSLTTNEKLYLFCGLIMAGLRTEGIAPLSLDDFKGNNNEKNNDGTIVLTSISSFLSNKNCSDEKIKMILGLLNSVFNKKVLWNPNNGESLLKILFGQVKSDIIPCLESNLHLDFTGKILNSLNDWVGIENDNKNDVVLTPRYVTTLMAKLARTNKDSFVWDKAMGSAGFLVSAMDIMIKDAKEKITDEKELEDKIKHIKENQLLGIEILGNIYILAVLNMILMGDGSSNILNGDSHKYNLQSNFPANVFLLNPPYSAPGKGFCFVEEALSQMTTGYASILIQDSAGNKKGLPYTKNILKNNTLLASIKMPTGLFIGKASVNVYIFVFKVARKHEIDDLVTFIDFSNDGYSRKNRKKSTQKINLKNTDHAEERYAEIEAIVLGKKPKTSYYTEENGLLIKDTITLNGDDWLFTHHQKIDVVPTEDDFKNTVANFLSWKVGQLIKGGK